MFDLIDTLGRLFYFPSCLLKMCDREDFLGFFIPGRHMGCYKVRCVWCKRQYVRNTQFPETRIPYNETWAEYWNMFHPICMEIDHEKKSRDPDKD